MFGEKRLAHFLYVFLYGIIGNECEQRAIAGNNLGVTRKAENLWCFPMSFAAGRRYWWRWQQRRIWNTKPIYTIQLLHGHIFRFAFDVSVLSIRVYLYPCVFVWDSANIAHTEGNWRTATVAISTPMIQKTTDIHILYIKCVRHAEIEEKLFYNVLLRFPTLIFLTALLCVAWYFLAAVMFSFVLPIFVVGWLLILQYCFCIHLLSSLFLFFLLHSSTTQKALNLTYLTNRMNFNICEAHGNYIDYICFYSNDINVTRNPHEIYLKCTRNVQDWYQFTWNVQEIHKSIFIRKRTLS